MEESGPAQLAAYVPERTCMACRRKRPQGELLRWTKNEGGAWTPDPFPRPKGFTRKGRGVYLCPDNPACWQEKRLKRTFGGHAERVAAQLKDLFSIRTT